MLGLSLYILKKNSFSLYWNLLPVCAFSKDGQNAPILIILDLILVYI
jgi:hypothetical protein